MPGKEVPLNGNRVLNGKQIKADGIQSSAFCALCERYYHFNQQLGLMVNHCKLDRERVYD